MDSLWEIISSGHAKKYRQDVYGANSVLNAQTKVSTWSPWSPFARLGVLPLPPILLLVGAANSAGWSYNYTYIPCLFRSLVTTKYTMYVRVRYSSEVF